MSKTRLNQILPADLVADFGVDGFRYHFLADLTFGADGDFSYEAMVARYNADLANNLGNLLARVATVVGKQCGGVGPAPRADSPLAEVASGGVRRRGGRLGRRAALRRARRDVAARAGHQRPPRGQRAMEGRARAGGRRRARRRPRSAPHRRGAGLAGRPRGGPGHLGTHRPHRPGRPISASPAPRPGAATRAACRWRRARRSSPARLDAAPRLNRARPGPTATAISATTPPRCWPRPGPPGCSSS